MHDKETLLAKVEILAELTEDDLELCWQSAEHWQMWTEMNCFVSELERREQAAAKDAMDMAEYERRWPMSAY